MPKAAKIPPLDPTFSSSELQVLSKPKLTKPALVVGLPGIGLVSKLAADNLVKSLDARLFARLFSPHFPNQVLALKSGKLRVFSIKFYHAKAGERDLVILRGDLQPLTVEGQYEVTARVLNFFKSLGGTQVIAMAGFATNKKVEKPRIFVSSTSKNFLKQVLSSGAALTEQPVPVVGMAGMLPALSKLYGLSGACLLVETPGMIADAQGASHLTALLSKLFGAKINVSSLDKRAKKAAAMFEQMEKQAQAAADSSLTGAKADRDVMRYIH